MKTSKKPARTSKNASPVKELSRVTKTARMPKTAQETARKTEAKAAPKQALTYRVFQLPVALWDSVKDSKGESSAHTFVTESVGSQLKPIVAALEAIGVQTQKTKRVRMARPDNWQELLDASEYSGIPAQTLMALSIYWQLNPSVRGGK